MLPNMELRVLLHHFAEEDAEGLGDAVGLVIFHHRRHVPTKCQAHDAEDCPVGEAIRCRPVPKFHHGFKVVRHLQL